MATSGLDQAQGLGFRGLGFGMVTHCIDSVYACMCVCVYVYVCVCVCVCLEPEARYAAPGLRGLRKCLRQS